MPKDRAFHRISSQTKPPHAPETPNDQPQAPTPNVSNTQIAVSATENDRTTIQGDHDRSIRSHPGALSAGDTSMGNATKQRMRLRDRIFRRSPGPDPNRPSQSSTPQPNHPMTAPVQNDPRSLLSPLPTEVIPTALVGDNDASVRTQQQPADIGLSVPTASSATAESAPRGSDSNRKNMIIGGTKVLLQTAAAALKLVPIPNLDQIPSILLSWIQIYENVSGNTEELVQLCDVIQQVQQSVLEPLEKWTKEEITPELEALVQEFHGALETQLEDIESVQKKLVIEKIIRAPDITQQITKMKSYLNDATRRFQLRISILTLLRAEQSSIESVLSRLNPALAEHTCVTSKSECLPGTRAKIQQSLLEHLSEAKNRFVWLRGSPGTGKTAICKSVASTIETKGSLAASFFWDKNQPGSGLDSIKQFPSTLAHQLACFNEDFKFSLVKLLRQPALVSVRGFPLEKQLNTLMIEPMRGLKDRFPSGKDRFVIVLDGLDECGNQETLESLMGLVLALQKLPPAFAMLVSSRPEQGVILAWSKPRTKELTIPCEDVDKMEHNEDFYTVRRMVEDGLRENSSWKPTEWELDAFSRACRGLPVIASIRIRDVCRQARRGRTLQSAFKGLLSVTDTPADLNHEYLRILRQAYEVDSAGIPPDVSKMYRLVITAILTASGLRNVSSMSQMFGISEDEIYATLEPISSIINLPSENESEITFYHATAREFITGEPIGDEKDKVFFIDDVNGYLLGLPLLRHFNDCCERNVFGIPTDPISLGEQEKWDEFKAKKKDYRSRFHYVVENLFKHLDPSQLFSQESNELQNEFDSFITRNSLLTFMHLQYHTSEVWDGRIFPSKLLEFNNHDSIQLLRDLHRVNQSAEYSPWRFYRMDLPFAQPSVYKQYGHLSGVRVFSIHDKFGDTIALSEDLCRAQEVMHAKLTERVRRWGQEINYEAEFYQPDIRNGVVSCAALSPDGRYVAFGFGSGVIEVADIDHQRTICQLQHNPANLPVWVEFVHGSHRVATEDIDGNVTVLGHGMAPVKLGNLPSGLYPAETAISDNGLFIIRAPRNFDNPWYNNMTLISVSDYPFIQPLTSPSGLSIPFAPPPSNHRHGGTEFSSSRPHRRTFGFSPGARYVSAFAGFNAFIWSTRSYELIACYRVTDSFHWIINPNRVPPTHLHLVPNPVFTQASPPLAEDDTAYAHRSDDAAHDSEDKSWIKRPFYDLSPELNDYRETNAWLASSATGENPLIWSQSVMFNGRKIFDLPAKYQPVTSLLPWYGHRVPESDRPGLGLYRLQSSRNGTRFLVQGESKAPIVIDISQIV